MELLGENLSVTFAAVLQEEDTLRLLVKKLRVLKKELSVPVPPSAGSVLGALANEIRRDEEARQAANSLSAAQRIVNSETVARLEAFAQKIRPVR